MAPVETTQKLVVAKVERSGEAIIIPESIKLEDAVTVLQQAIQYEDTKIQKQTVFDYEPFEVAGAFGKAINKVCGALLGQSTWSFWEGEQPPREISVEVAPGVYEKVLWGEITFPLDPKNGKLVTGAQRQGDGRWFGQITGVFKQKYMKVWDELVQETRRILLNESMFKGRTLRIRFLQEDGDVAAVPTIKPWDVTKASSAKLVFPRKLEAEIEDHIYTPIRNRAETMAAGVPFKRGILLAGRYGTGKTELAAAVAKEAALRGMTVVYIEDVRELPFAIRFAARLAPAVVFAEDLDRITSDERNHEIDVLLNTLDGIDTKIFPVMTILTTNYPERIYKGMVRPGRIDVALQIEPPDAEAAIRLVKGYLGTMYADSPDGDESVLGDELIGMIPAVIREICERSKLSYISRTKKTPEPNSITAQDVIRAAGSMKNQIELLEGKHETKRPIGRVIGVMHEIEEAIY